MIRPSTYDPDKHRRRSIRLQGYDYRQAGAYFVTICARHRDCLFGDVEDGSIRLNDAGQIVVTTWRWLERQYDDVALDAWVAMPNHLHGIIVITDCGRGGSRTVPTAGRTAAPTRNRKPLGRLIGAFKTVSTKQINAMRNTPGAAVWQRNYYEHIIRNDGSLNRIREYIANNPMQWEPDRENPHVRAVREPPRPDDEPWCT